VRKTLLITNDFPPRAGGIQCYLHELARRLPGGELVVYAPAAVGSDHHDAHAPYPVIRHPRSLMLPIRDVLRGAQRIVRAERCEAVWFGAAAPLALLAPKLRACGVGRVLACAHGHEVGYALVPPGRAVLRRIGAGADIVTFVSSYTRSRFASAFGPVSALEPLAPGVDTLRFAPSPDARTRLRNYYGLGERPVVVCVSRLVPRKGQDVLIRALPRIRRVLPGTLLLVVGEGGDRRRLETLAAQTGVSESVLFTGAVAPEDLPAHYNCSDVFAMPCRTRVGGLDVEGLGMVFLEASASGLPVVAGRSGGAPETVLEGRTGTVVDGRDVRAVSDAVAAPLLWPALAARRGAAGREWVRREWSWEARAQRLAELLTLGASVARSEIAASS
jgi:phosphatidylinositol alpha-1,6-mannosyltransferase